MTVDDIFAGVKKHLDDGVDFITVHCGVTRETVARMDQEGRLMEVVSRGGSFTVGWMDYNDAENRSVPTMLSSPWEMVSARAVLLMRLTAPRFRNYLSSAN